MPSLGDEPSFAARFALEEAAAAGESSGSAGLKKLLHEAAVFSAGSLGAQLAGSLPQLRLEALLAKKAGQRRDGCGCGADSLLMRRRAIPSSCRAPT